MNTSNLKPFRLEDFKSNEETPVVDDAGRQVELYLRKRCLSPFLVIACSEGDWAAYTYTRDGRQSVDGPVELFFAPRKKVVPLSLEDIKPGMVFRGKGTSVFLFPTMAGLAGVFLPAAGALKSFFELQANYEYSFDRLTWHRCEKEVEA